MLLLHTLNHMGKSCSKFDWILPYGFGEDRVKDRLMDVQTEK